MSDAEAKAIMVKWPVRTSLMWSVGNGEGYWIRARPKDSKVPAPTLYAPGASLFNTQPDGLWVLFYENNYCAVVAIEVCGNGQNINDKRSRYIPSNHSFILGCSLKWLEENVTVQKGGILPRHSASERISQA